MGCKYVKEFDFEPKPVKKAQGGPVKKPAATKPVATLPVVKAACAKK